MAEKINGVYTVYQKILHSIFGYLDLGHVVDYVELVNILHEVKYVPHRHSLTTGGNIFATFVTSITLSGKADSG